MRTTFLTLSLAALFSAIDALIFTSPAAGASIDPTQPILVTWTGSSNDPATFDLVLDQSESLALTHNVRVGSDVPTAPGSYQIPANSAMTYGSGFVIKAQSGGVDIAISPPFDLSISLTQVTTGGSIQIVQVTTAGSTASVGSVGPNPATQTAIPTSGQAAPFSSAPASSGATNSAISTHNTGPTSVFSSGLGSVSGVNAISASGSSSKFTTSTTSTSRLSSSTGSASTSTASSTAANAQPRLRSDGQIAIGAAGVLAGLIALLT